MTPRNPWTGIHAGREFLYDLRHPVLFHRRAWGGITGETKLPRFHRVLGIGLIVEGVALFTLGLVALILGA